LGYLASAVVLVGVANAHDRIVAALLIALAVCIQMITVSAAWSVCLDIGRQHAGVVTGFMNMFGNLGGTVAPLVVGYMAERWGSLTFPFYASAGVSIAGMIMWLLINPQRPLYDEESVI
jgi:ACS family glucarate transporter-like MFS transporter